MASGSEIQVPVEAVEAGLKPVAPYLGGWANGSEEQETRRRVRLVLNAAYPAIRSQVLAEVREALRGAFEPKCDRCGVEYVEDYRGPCQEPLSETGNLICQGTVRVDPEAAVQAALASLTPESDRG